MLAMWSLVPLRFLNPACTSGHSHFTYYWSLAWRIMSITLLAHEMSTTVWQLECSLALPFLGSEWKLFQSCGNCWVFPICWHIECSPLTASSFRIWNSSAGMSSSPLVLFVVMLSKAHLTSHSRMSGSRWVTTPLWLTGSLRPFLYSFSVYSYHLFLISSAFVMSLPFLSFIEPIIAWNVPLVSQIFSKKSLVFPILLFLSVSPCYSLELCIQLGISFPPDVASTTARGETFSDCSQPLQPVALRFLSFYFTSLHLEFVGYI